VNELGSVAVDAKPDGTYYVEVRDVPGKRTVLTQIPADDAEGPVKETVYAKR
jgi:hypothetical protein